MWQQDGDAERQHADREFDHGEHSKEVSPGGVRPVRTGPRCVAANTQAQHENRGDDGGRIDRVTEDVGEYADPDDLVNQRAGAGEEKQQKKHVGTEATAFRISLTNMS